jgi:hypothetical protein
MCLLGLRLVRYKGPRCDDTSGRKLSDADNLWVDGSHACTYLHAEWLPASTSAPLAIRNLQHSTLALEHASFNCQLALPQVVIFTYI